MGFAVWFEGLSLWARWTAAMAGVVVLTAAVSRLGLAATLIAAAGGAVVAGVPARAMIRSSFPEAEPQDSEANVCAALGDYPKPIFLRLSAVSDRQQSISMVVYPRRRRCPIGEI
jgi:hypothetical protein